MARGESIKTMPAGFLLEEGPLIKEVHYLERLNDRMGVDKIRAFATRQNRDAPGKEQSALEPS
jgi:hypothetical protein